MEDEISKFVLANHPAQFPESEERDKGAENDDGSSEQVIEPDVVKRANDVFPMNKPLDHLLKEVEGEDKQAKEKGLVDSRIEQWLGLHLLPKMGNLSDENHFCDDEGVDQRSPISEIRDMEFTQQEHAVGCQGAEEKSQIPKDDKEFLKLVSGPLFQAGFLGIFSRHLAHLFPEAFVLPLLKPTDSSACAD